MTATKKTNTNGGKAVSAKALTIKLRSSKPEVKTSGSQELPIAKPLFVEKDDVLLEVPPRPKVEDSMVSSGSVAGRFRIIRKLGAGAFGQVYLGCDSTVPDRQVMNPCNTTH